MVQRVAMEASDLVAAKAADQSPTTFRVFITFNDDKMTPSGINTHHTLRCVCATRGGQRAGKTSSLVVSDEYSSSLTQVSRSDLAGLTAAQARLWSPAPVEATVPGPLLWTSARDWPISHTSEETADLLYASGAGPVQSDARRCWMPRLQTRRAFD